ncbi:hypothetical protein ANN_06508 [Periplaneta americana]|uniref:Reverse transcriptase n=1 Tax=Periplaneta americana TaxID=6978 RepID=A0ABQ8TEZ9_PERAM|nr:hypothetical protein ANN_06508 [Periplaneta americana]
MRHPGPPTLSLCVSPHKETAQEVRHRQYFIEEREKHHPPANKWIQQPDHLTSSEWRLALKMTANIYPLHAIPGRSRDRNHCRCVSEIETLGHILGACPFNEMLQNSTSQNQVHTEGREANLAAEIVMTHRDLLSIVLCASLCNPVSNGSSTALILKLGAILNPQWLTTPRTAANPGFEQVTPFVPRKLLKDIPPEPRRLAVVSFCLNTEHDILGKHLNRLGILPSASCILCHQQKDMDRQHLAKCPALKSSKEVDHYWEARARMTLLQAGKLENLKEDDVMRISEMRWENSGSRVKDKVISVCYVDDRMIMVRLQEKKTDLALVQIYMPHSGLSHEGVEESYDKLEEIVEKEKKEACVILMGDWNAAVGEGQDGS